MAVSKEQVKKLFTTKSEDKRKTRDLTWVDPIEIKRAEIEQIYVSPRTGTLCMRVNGNVLAKHPDSLVVSEPEEITKCYAIAVVNKEIADEDIEESDISYMFKVTKKSAKKGWLD